MKSILLVKKLLGLVEMTSGLVNASFSLPDWQAVKMIFFARCFTDDATSGGRVLDPRGQLQCMGTLGANGLKYLLPNRISHSSYYKILARFWFYLSLFLLPKSLLILSNTVLRGS